MASARIPSTTLLRTFLKPSPCTTCQIRMASGYMPKTKYHKINALDKLHRRQKKAIRDEKQAALDRANAMTITPQPTTVSQPTQPVPQLPFSINRTTMHNIPVYETMKHGGSKHITQIRRLSGDLDAMVEQLRQVLHLDATYTDVRGKKKENISINRLTRHVIVKGWRGAEVKKWVESLGF